MNQRQRWRPGAVLPAAEPKTESWRKDLNAMFERMDRIEKEQRLAHEFKEIERGLMGLLFTVRNATSRKDVKERLKTAGPLLDNIIQRLEEIQRRALKERERV